MDTAHSNTPKLRVLMLGPLPPPLGGTRVSFQFLLRELSHCQAIETISVRQPFFRESAILFPFCFIQWVWRLWHYSGKADVISLHCGSQAIWILGSIVRICAILRKKIFIVRVFGGRTIPDNIFPLARWLTVKALRSADLVLLQTHRQLEAARKTNLRNLAWHPTNRPMPRYDVVQKESTRVCKRFIYVGHLREYKGIHDLIEAFSGLPPEAECAVYGPFRDGMRRNIFNGLKNIEYRGELAPNEVIPTIRQFDALVLPTRAESEGYPGVILEAFAAGTPVISTTCGAIPELVDDTCGILVPPRDPNALRAAMRKLMDDPNYCHSLAQGAVNKRRQFDSGYWAEQFANCCIQLAQAPDKFR